MAKETRLDRIEFKIDKIVEVQTTMLIEQGKQHQTLQEHTRRSDLLEAEVKPVKKHVELMNAVAKIGGGIMLAIGGIEGIVALLEYIGKHK